MTARGRTLNRVLDMPTYEYVCDKCGHQFDLFQSMKADPLTVCPKELCKKKKWGKGKVRKLMSAGAGLIFKGSGFYITDYRSANYKEGAKKDTTPSSTDSSGSTAKSETKSETKSESKSESKPKTESKPTESKSKPTKT